MEKYIITISREFGCNAREVARQLAARLNVKLYDQELVDMTARKAGLNVDFVKSADEKLQKSSNSFIQYFGYGSSTEFYSEKAVNAQIDVIREIANKNEPCILFGRCGDFVLREYPNVLKIYLYAPESARIAHIAMDYELTMQNAIKLIQRVDKQKRNYYNFVTGHNREDLKEKDVMIDVNTYGIDGTVDLIVKALEIFKTAKGGLSSETN